MTLVDQKKLFLKFGFILIILLAVSGYGYFKMRNLISGPRITIYEPKSGSEFATSAISVRGVVKNIAFLSLNDRQIFVDEKGDFSETVILLPGYNIITLKGEDKFGKKMEEVLKLVLKD